MHHSLVLKANDSNGVFYHHARCWMRHIGSSRQVIMTIDSAVLCALHHNTQLQMPSTTLDFPGCFMRSADCCSVNTLQRLLRNLNRAPRCLVLRWCCNGGGSLMVI